MFGVYDNGKPASGVGFPVLKGGGWDTHQFQTFEEAEKYAQNWLGLYAGVTLEVNKPVDYDGYGTTIEIREESNE
jgi:hypothetical protein